MKIRRYFKGLLKWLNVKIFQIFTLGVKTEYDAQAPVKTASFAEITAKLACLSVCEGRGVATCSPKERKQSWKIRCDVTSQDDGRSDVTKCKRRARLCEV